jgi:hypothetical protein
MPRKWHVRFYRRVVPATMHGPPRWKARPLIRRAALARETTCIDLPPWRLGLTRDRYAVLGRRLVARVVKAACLLPSTRCPENCQVSDARRGANIMISGSRKPCSRYQGQWLRALLPQLVWADVKADVVELLLGVLENDTFLSYAIYRIRQYVEVLAEAEPPGLDLDDLAMHSDDRANLFARDITDFHAGRDLTCHLCWPFQHAVTPSTLTYWPCSPRLHVRTFCSLAQRARGRKPAGSRPLTAVTPRRAEAQGRGGLVRATGRPEAGQSRGTALAL